MKLHRLLLLEVVAVDEQRLVPHVREHVVVNVEHVVGVERMTLMIPNSRTFHSSTQSRKSMVRFRSGSTSQLQKRLENGLHNFGWMFLIRSMWHFNAH
jgi:hypothetical protein